MSTPVPAFPAAAVESVCRELAELMTGSQIRALIGPLNVTEPASAQGATKWKRLFNVVAEAQNRQGDGRPLVRLITEAMQPVRFEGPAHFESARSRVNSKLLLYGYSVRDDGKVAVAKRARTLPEAHQRADDLNFALRQRDIHPIVLEFSRPELLEGNYFHAVLEATKSVAERIREMTGIDQDGSSLMDAATGTKHGLPPLAFNALASESERSEHSGLALMAKGLFSAVRNPTAHAPKVRWAINRQDALDTLTLISLLHRRLDVARVHPLNGAGRTETA